MSDWQFEDDRHQKQRCEGCGYKHIVHASGGFSFNGCYHRPYIGKWVATIKDCPKGMSKEKIEKAIKTMQQHKCEEIVLYGEEYDTAIKCLESVSRIIDVLKKRNNAFDNQEFGATYSDLDSIIEEIREVIEEGSGRSAFN